MRISVTLCILFGSALVAERAVAQQLQRFEVTQPQMGVPFRVVLYARDKPTAQTAVDAAMARAAQLNRILSDYDPESELSRLSRQSPTKTPVRVSDDLWAVLAAAKQMSEASEGAFDITVGPLTRLWRRARRLKKLPGDERIADAKRAVGFRLVCLDKASQSVSLRRPEMRLDLGGIGKGYAADQMLATLKKHGIRRALVDASGDLALGDPPPDAKGWRIAVAPLDAGAAPSRFLTLANCGVATSGDAWQYVEIDGRRYSHIVDPDTGIGLTSRSSVTVVAPNGTLADAYASTLSVLGPEQGIKFADRNGIRALVVAVIDGKTRVDHSQRFKELSSDEEP